MDFNAVVAQLNGIPAAIIASAIFAALGYLVATFRSRRPTVVWGEAPNPLVALKNGDPGISMQFKSIFSENCGSTIVPEIRVRVTGDFSTITTTPDKHYEIRDVPNRPDRKEVVIHNLLPKEVLRVDVMGIRLGLHHEGWDKLAEIEIASLSAGVHRVANTSFEPISAYTKLRERMLSFFLGMITFAAALGISFAFFLAS